ncbi:hypothetical protein [Nitrobacter sp. TKz-YC02]|uniref:hypothetical protein n=1 Tax=Nitrobacter sp. TKz-YC02 TaxID=3398704 RepID=UPI003CEA8419
MGNVQEGGSWSVVTDLEEGIGAVRKKWAASLTAGKVLRWCEVLAQHESRAKARLGNVAGYFQKQGEMAGKAVLIF